MHKLSVAYNWDERLIDEVVKNKYPVKDFYASAQQTSIGGGRPSSILPKTTKKLIQDHIIKMHENGIEFTYTLNAPCMGGQEFLPKIHTNMIDELKWISEIGCDGVVVTIPYLIELIKKQFPQLKIRVSTIAKVNAVNKAKYFETLGASAITPDVMINRNFKLLEKMVQATSCEINLLMTDGCLYECPYRLYHYNLCGHASQTYGIPDAYRDYPVIHCTIDKFTNPAEVMKCRWIRPEDIPHYEEIGIETFKIGGRRLPTEKILESVKAYSEKKYDGNLADIIEGFSFSPEYVNDGDNTAVGDAVNTEKKPMFKIDNTKLGGFIDFFKKQDCESNCGDCTYCAEWAKKAITMRKVDMEVFLISMRSVLDGLISSRGLKIDKKKRK